MHGAIQIFVFYLVLWAVSHVHWVLPKPFDKIMLQVEILFAGGFAVSTIFGIHLVLTNLILGNHDNEAFSSLRYEGFKNILRMHIQKDSITIYPIGVRQVCDWTTDVASMTATTKDTLKTTLIEAPILIEYKNEY